MEKVQIIPAPKEVDPRMLAWKGGAVLAKMDAAADLWVTASDWVRILCFDFILASSCRLSSPR